MTVTSDVGLQLLTQRLRPAVDPPLGRGIDAVGRPRGAPGGRRDVDQVAATPTRLHLPLRRFVERLNPKGHPISIANLGRVRFPNKRRPRFSAEQTLPG
jgi:hypothetical protein